MSNRKKQSDGEVIATNRRAKYDYTILSTLECGLVLQGTEVKSLRARHVQFADAYALAKNGELFLMGVNIDTFAQGTHSNHEPDRTRKLLAHKREIQKLAKHVKEKRRTLVPMRLYFKHGRAKILIGLAEGKARMDKRNVIQKRHQDRDVARALKRGAGR